MAFEEIGRSIGEINDTERKKLSERAKQFEQIKLTDEKERKRDEVKELIGVITDLHYRWSGEVSKGEVFDNSKKMTRKAWFQASVLVFEWALDLSRIKLIEISPELSKEILDYKDKLAEELSDYKKRGELIEHVDSKIEDTNKLLKNILEELMMD
ncbi:MAG: hypothetical protein C0412_11540 [Flavobacterium sp.]|nr:hypothetical protein [Flavobacterium sp.]